MTKILFWLALTVYHEARGESDAGQKAVVKVILNRADRLVRAPLAPLPVDAVVTARKQFSCFNKGLKDPAVWIRDVAAFQRVMANAQEGLEEWRDGDTLSGATHYYAIKGMVDGKPPYWAASMEFITEIGGHRFLREG